MYFMFNDGVKTNRTVIFLCLLSISICKIIKILRGYKYEKVKLLITFGT